ncbi:hypothetical protein FNV43_RR04626 [Rhamnella rubrinervis]|uniref:Uncharacterized protein n=1 Tax=Rhamnella rubrinervis TaxID=2594499 RepID=A0A8K0HL35_9ROSA|nr:hypothetical protein FNV43_RR04626 [Rhamnella rubrinervis]
MSAAFVSTSTLIAAPATSGRLGSKTRRSTKSIFNSKLFAEPAQHHHRITNDSSRTELLNPASSSDERSEGDKLVDGMEFGELCNEFECDPVRSFSGREKYKRSLWATNSLHNPSVTVQEMVMLSTSVLNIKWTIRGKPKSLIAGIFWTSRRLFATIEAGKDLTDIAKSLSNRFSREKENPEIYPDPAGDPTKFFQRDDSFQRDAYQIALFLAVVYFVVQFLRTTL